MTSLEHGSRTRCGAAGLAWHRLRPREVDHARDRLSILHVYKALIMVSFSVASFALAHVLAGYLAALTCRPPNANSDKNWGQDSIRFTTGPVFLTLVQACAFGLSLTHALVAIQLENGAIPLGANDHLNPGLFVWTPFTTSCLVVLIFIGAPLRLAAYGALGKRFTFGLAAPDKLNTRGIYAWMQHPSYTGAILVMICHQILSFRWDGVPALLIPRAFLDTLRGYGLIAFATHHALVFSMVAVRISEEEAMLRDTFGAEWEKWHQKTSRLIPGLL